MNRRIVVASLLVVGIFLVAPLGAQTANVVRPTKSDVEVNYREGMQMEQLRLYPKARGVYRDIARQFIRQVESGGRSREASIAQLPVVISAVYRLGIVTARDNYYNVHPLVYQLDSFQNTQDTIDEVLVIVGELRRQGLVSRAMYESLYFSRAFNRIAWANKLLLGTAWKNYVVCPPSTVIGMIDLAMADLEQLLVLQELPPTLTVLASPSANATEQFQVLNDRYAQKFKSLEKGGTELKTYQLMNVEDDPANLARLTAKRTHNQVYSVLSFYNASDTQQIVADAKGRYTLDRILSDENQPFYKVCRQLVGMIGVY